MIKVFKANEKGKIELTVEELTQLLQEAEEEGRRNAIISQLQPSITPTQPITTPVYPQPWWAVPYCSDKTISSPNDVWTTVTGTGTAK